MKRRLVACRSEAGANLAIRPRTTKETEQQKQKTNNDTTHDASAKKILEKCVSAQRRQQAALRQCT
jgi:predicted type IV restriction endonuclease